MNSRELYLTFNAIDDDILEQSECEVQTVSFWGSHRLLKQCVAACLAVVIVFSGLMSVEACRKKIIEVITQVFPSFTYFQYSTDEEPKYTVVPEVDLTYIPAGFELTENRETETRAWITYEDANGRFFEFSLALVLPNGSYGHLLDTENVDAEFFYIGNEEAVAYDDPERQTVLWNFENIRYDLNGTIGLDELKQIASGVVIKETDLNGE